MDGYDFEGWYTEANGAGTLVTDASTNNATEDQTLYAEWFPTLGFFEVNYDIGYSGGTDPDSQSYMIIDFLSLPDVSRDRDGYTFDGWFNGETPMTDEDPAGNYNLTAQWTPIANYFTISYDLGYANAPTAPSPQDYTIDGLLRLPTAPVRAGYFFEHWESFLYTATEFMNVSDLAPDFTLTAIWDLDPNWFTVSYNSAGGSPIFAQKYAINGEISLPAAPAQYGYNFAGWYLSTIPTLRFIGGEAAGNITLVAHWTDWAENDPRWGP